MNFSVLRNMHKNKLNKYTMQFFIEILYLKAAVLTNQMKDKDLWLLTQHYTVVNGQMVLLKSDLGVPGINGNLAPTVNRADTEIDVSSDTVNL